MTLKLNFKVKLQSELKVKGKRFAEILSLDVLRGNLQVLCHRAREAVGPRRGDPQCRRRASLLSAAALHESQKDGLKIDFDVTRKEKKEKKSLLKKRI